MKSIPEPTQLIAGMTHREMLEVMRSNDIFCSPDRFARILQDAQRRALAQVMAADGPAVEIRVVNDPAELAEAGVR